MYVLVFWIKEKQYSIVNIEQLCPEKEEGVNTLVAIGRKKSSAKILKKSRKFCDERTFTVLHEI